MRKIKLIIPIVLLFMVIGFATITTSLSINADMELLGDLDNFAIYYSRAVVNGQVDPSIIVSSTELDFGAALKEVGTPYVIEYDITNASSSFDAQIEMTCTGSTEYFEISNEFDTSEPLGARQTRTGVLTLKKIKTLAGDAINSTVSCSVVATPVERNTQVNDDVPIPIENPYPIGKEVTIGTEKFNIIGSTDDSVTMLAQYNISDVSPYKQTSTDTWVYFSENSGWEYTPGPKEINIQDYDGEVKTLLNNYVLYLNNKYGLNATGNLISLFELGKLGCTIPEDYGWGDGSYGCDGSKHREWLITDQYWWTRSAFSNDPGTIWYVLSSSFSGLLDYADFGTDVGIRPTITVSKETAYSLIHYPVYEIGDEIILGGDVFNFIGYNGNNVRLLRNELLGYSYLTSGFAVSEGEPYYYMTDHSYVDRELLTYANELKNKSLIENISVSLLSKADLVNLGCSVTEDECEHGCVGGWLYPVGSWWLSDSEIVDGIEFHWVFSYTGSLYKLEHGDVGVRPLIEVSIDDLEKSNNYIAYDIGQELFIGNSKVKFNVISDNGATVSLLPYVGVLSSYHEEEEYINFLKEIIQYDNIAPRDLSVFELYDFGCTIRYYDHANTDGSSNCDNSPHKSWLINGQNWKISESFWDENADLFQGIVSSVGHIKGDESSDIYYRPVITVPKSALSNLDLSGALISFSIMGTTYQAREGMTWGEWVESDYNSSKYYVILEDMITDSGGYPVTYGGISVGISEKIVANRNYDNYS